VRRILHFLVLGALLFAGSRVLPGTERRERLVVPAVTVERLAREWRERTGRAPDAATLDALVREHVDEELLFRRGLERGLHRSDPVVVERLVRDMRFVGADPDASDAALHRRALALGLERVDPVVRRRLVQRMKDAYRASVPREVPDDAALRAFAEQHRERFAVPERVAFHQVFVSPARRGADAEADARALRAALEREGAGPDAAAGRGDPSALPARVGPASQREIARRFGEAFAERVAALPPGGWRGPVASPYGLHLVYVTAREPGALPPLDAMRGALVRAWWAAREEAALARGLARLRARHEIRVEGASDAASP